MKTCSGPGGPGPGGPGPGGAGPGGPGPAGPGPDHPPSRPRTTRRHAPGPHAALRFPPFPGPFPLVDRINLKHSLR